MRNSGDERVWNLVFILLRRVGRQRKRAREELRFRIDRARLAGGGIDAHDPGTFGRLRTEEPVGVCLGNRVVAMIRKILHLLRIGELRCRRDREADRVAEEGLLPARFRERVGVGRETILVAHLEDVLHDAPFTEVLDVRHADRRSTFLQDDLLLGRLLLIRRGLRYPTCGERKANETEERDVTNLLHG